MARIDLYWMIGLTVLIEGITCLFRFGIGMQSTRDTGAIGEFTFGIRIHHGYIGLLMIGVAFLFPEDSFLRTWLARIGVAMAVSDLIHHFLVLWPVTGDPQFHLTYPKPTAPPTHEGG